jgi:hypothetical protein
MHRQYTCVAPSITMNLSDSPKQLNAMSGIKGHATLPHRRRSLSGLLVPAVVDRAFLREDRLLISESFPVVVAAVRVEPLLHFGGHGEDDTERWELSGRTVPSERSKARWMPIARNLARNVVDFIDEQE